jgi:putative ABC transport system substrate-binding protein
LLTEQFDMSMRRRTFIWGVGPAVLGPFVASAQRRPPLVAIWVGAAADPQAHERAAVFRSALSSLGWIDNRNIRLEIIWADIAGERVNAAASDLVNLNPDVIVSTGAPMLGALYRKTKSIPIIFTFVTDPVTDGFVASLANPGGNITGFTIFEHSFAGKWLEMLKEVAPELTRVMVMQNPDHPAWPNYLRAIHSIAAGRGVEVKPAPVNDAAEIEQAFASFGHGPHGGLILLPSFVATKYRDLIATLALKNRLSSIYSLPLYPRSGGLMSYGVVLGEPYRQAAIYADRILKGEKASQLPVQASTKFEMVINLKTARALGIEVPPTMLGRADEVIE